MADCDQGMEIVLGRLSRHVTAAAGAHRATAVKQIGDNLHMVSQKKAPNSSSSSSSSSKGNTYTFFLIPARVLTLSLTLSLVVALFACVPSCLGVHRGR